MDPPPASESAVSSPRSSGGGRLRLMCSFGGHIVPRPHDKSLCYVGGETRIVVVDRDSSLDDLTARISKTLLGGCGFGLKYQLPNEDLDSLISVTTDEDLEIMVDEFDRAASSPKPSRLRVFLFPSNPDPSQSQSSIGQLKSESWFLSALNGAVSADRDRGFPDSASVNSLLGLGDEPISNDGAAARSGGDASSMARDLETRKGSRQGQDVHSVPDSPMLETSSSFGSTSSSPSLANLPPIRVHAAEDGAAAAGGGAVQDRRLGIEEQFAQIGVSAGQKQEEGFAAMSSPPPPMPTTLAAAAMSSGLVAGEYTNRVVSDDERSEHGVSIGYRKHPTQQQQRASAGFDSASPDSVSSDSSIANALSRAKPVIYQEQLVQLPSGTGRVSANANPVDPNARVLVQDPGYVFQHQFDPQQQFINAGAHYIQHHPGGAPVPAYYPMYAPQQPHPQLDQQYPVYYMPARPGQAPIPSMVQQPPPAYTATRIPLQPEMAAGMYRTTGTPAVVQAPLSQQQFVGFSQMQYPSQSVESVAPTTSSPASYAYEYPETAHPSIYYTQPLAPTMSPAQYQTMTTGAAAVSSLPDGPNDAIKQQQVRTSQPI